MGASKDNVGVQLYPPNLLRIRDLLASWNIFHWRPSILKFILFRHTCFNYESHTWTVWFQTRTCRYLSWREINIFFDMLRSRPLFHTWIDIIFLSSNQIYLEVEKNKTARKKRSDSHMSFCHSIIEFPLSSVTNVLHKKFWVHTVYFTLEYEANHMSRDMTKPTKWLCAQRRLRSAWTSAQSDQSLRCPHEESLGS